MLNQLISKQIIRNRYSCNMMDADDDGVVFFFKQAEKEDDSPPMVEDVMTRSGTILPGPSTSQPKDKSKGKHKANKPAPTEPPPNPKKVSRGQYNILSHLRRIPTMMSVCDALMMDKTLRETLIEVLLNPE